MTPGSLVTGGALRFARYALPPNRLGYCGPSDDVALFEQAAVLARRRSAGGSGRSDAGPGPGPVPVGEPDGLDLGELVDGLRHLAGDFEGAWPYLELIAGANHLEDPLDDRVVSSYWLGGGSLGAVSALEAGNHVEERFRPRAGRSWAQVSAALEPGAELSHGFHVMVVGPWIGLLRAGRVEAPLRVMDRCRVRWGEVLELSGDTAVVRQRPLRLHEGRLGLGEHLVEVVRLGEDGVSPCGEVVPGDVVSMHWDWVCEVLGQADLAALRRSTAVAVSAANRSLAVAPRHELD